MGLKKSLVETSMIDSPNCKSGNATHYVLFMVEVFHFMNTIPLEFFLVQFVSSFMFKFYDIPMYWFMICGTLQVHDNSFCVDDIFNEGCGNFLLKFWSFFQKHLKQIMF